MSRELEIGEEIKMYEDLIVSIEEQIGKLRMEASLYRGAIRDKKAELEDIIEVQRRKGGA